MAGLIEVLVNDNGKMPAVASVDVKAVPVMDVADVVAFEQRIAQEGTSLYTLITRAGKAVADAVRQHVPVGANVVILAGSGNNGGDGWVAAEDLAEEGYKVALISKTLAAEIKAEPARTAALKAEKTGSFCTKVDPDSSAVEVALVRADVVVDAILGTGFSYSEVREPYASWIELANEAHGRRSKRVGENESKEEGNSKDVCEYQSGSAEEASIVKQRLETEGAWLIAVDCPSGLNAQTGIPAQACICADETVTMLAVKTGLLAPEAAAYVGQLRLALLDREECSNL